MRPSIPAALITTDSAFRDQLAQLLAEPGHGFSLAAEIALPFLQIDEAQLALLRETAPRLIVLDLERDAEVGIKLAQFLADQQPDRQFVAVGPVLAPELLMQAMRAGITEYLPKPVTREALVAALQRMEKKLGGGSAASAREPGRVLTFLSAKGGSGSTTVATNLAVHLHKLTGKKVLLVDLDLELGEIALFLGVRPRFNLVDLVRNFHRMDAELLASYIEQHKSGVHLLSAPYHPDRVEAVDGEQIRGILQFLRQHYDYVLVDTPRSFTPATLAAFEQADQLYLVTTVDLPSLRNIKRSLPLLDRITGGHMKEKVRLVVNRHDSSVTEISADEVERTLGLSTYWRLGNDYETVIRSINSGEPLVLSANGSSPFARDLRAMGAELSGLGEMASGRKGGFLGLRRLLGGRKEPTHG
jgi:pilus assembly protein CpaE